MKGLSLFAALLCVFCFAGLHGLQTPEDEQRSTFFESLASKAEKCEAPIGQIPAILHVICLGPKPPALAGLSSWIDQHSGWKVKLWSDHPHLLLHPALEICGEERFPLEELAPCFHQAEDYEERSILLRYAILLSEGGICMDANSVCRSALETLRKEYDFFCELEELKPTLRSSTVNPSSRFLASTAEHPILKSAKEWLVEHWQEYEELFPGSDPVSVESRIVHRSEHALSRGIECASLKDGRKDRVFPADTFSLKTSMAVQRNEAGTVRAELRFSLFFVFVLAALNLFLGAAIFYCYRKWKTR